MPKMFDGARVHPRPGFVAVAARFQVGNAPPFVELRGVSVAG